MGFFTRSKVFGNNNDLEREIVTLKANVIRLERENSDLERTAIEQSSAAERAEHELKEVKKGAKALRKMIAELTAGHEASLLKLGRDYMMRIVELQTQVTGLTAQRDTAQANFEWARLMFNKGEAERAILTARIIERPVQPFAIERDAGPPTDGTAGTAVPAPDGVDRPRQTAAVDTAIGGLANRFGVMFEDVGDDDARTLGIDHESEA